MSDITPLAAPIINLTHAQSAFPTQPHPPPKEAGTPMPRCGFSTEEQSSSFDKVLEDIRQYARDHATGDVDSAFANSTPHGVFVGVGNSEFMFSPYRGDATDVDIHLSSGLYSFDELRTLKLPRPAPVIEGLLFEGETCLLAGRPKVGKTRLVHHMAFAIESGTRFLGMDVQGQRRVLIVDLENRPAAIQDRLVRMAGVGVSAPGLFIWSAHSLSEDVVNATSDGVAKLKGMIEETGADVLIIDPWRLWLGKDENNAEEVVHGLRMLSSLRDSNPRLTIVVVHHVRKERFESPRKLLEDPRLWVESVSGHHALLSHVDSCYGLERQRDEKDGEEWIVFGGVARNTDPRTLVLEDDEDSLRFEVRQGEAVLETVLTAKELEIWKTAAQLKQFGFNELLNKAGVKNRKAASRMLKQAESHGLIVRSEKGYSVIKSSA
jgi:KaiC/GvpD/RAD55 family RecA-like ATPase